MKEYNVKRHYTTHHGSFSVSFPDGSEERRRKIQGLLTSFKRSQVAIGRFCTEQERSMIASLRVAWTLTRHKRPFSESETIKDCMLAVIDEIVVDQKVKESVTSSIKKVPLSDTTTLRRVELLANDVSKKLMENLRKTEFMSVAVDESTDCTDMAQLCIYVRFFDGVQLREELLGLVPLEGHTTGEVIFLSFCDQVFNVTVFAVIVEETTYHNQVNKTLLWLCLTYLITFKTFIFTLR